MENLRREILATGSLIFFLTLISMSSLSRAQGRQVVFSVTGDVPYSSSEVKTFKKQVANHNKYSPSAFFVHVGDIISGGASCTESSYSTVAGAMKDLTVPACIVPGDNEVIDCKSASSGMNLFLKHFNNFEKNFCNAPVTERQSARPENWAFTLDGVLVIGIDLVYSAKSVEKQAAEWIEQQMEAASTSSATGAQVRAAVVFAHFDPNVSSSFSKPFRSAAKAFGKPVLFAHGHGHSWSTSFPFPEKNIFRMQVNMGGNEEPVQVTVTMDASSPARAFLLKRKPGSSKTTLTPPPCVNAGADQTIAAATATLQGSVSNSTGAFTTAWSQASGPGTATFGDANALATAASFSAAGKYVLRLTAESGPLRKSDDVTIIVNGGGVITHALTANISGSGQVGLNPAGGVYNAGTVVTLTATPSTGFQFSGWSGDLSGSTNPATLTMNANKTVTATFTPLPPTKRTLTLNQVGSGNVALNPAGADGVYDHNTVVTLTATPMPGFQFSGWSGDLSGSTNPTTITMDGNKTVTPAFAPLPITVTHEQTMSGSVSNSATVTTGEKLKAANGNLYLAAISMRPKIAVTSVSGFGLTWKLVRAKCSGRNTTAIEVWMAQASTSSASAPSSDAEVTATFAGVPSTAVIAVSRYSNVLAANPLGNILAGNTTGMNTDGVCAGGVDKNAYSFDLATTKNDAIIYAAVAAKAVTHTPGAGYLKRAAVQKADGLNTSSVAVADEAVVSPAILPVNGTFSGVVDWAVVALEIKPSAPTPAANAESAFLAKQQEAITALPNEFVLRQNYPNPFSASGISDNPSTQIGFNLPQASPVQIKVYSINGVEVATVVDDNFSAGNHTVRFQPQHLPSGTYFYVMQAGAFRQVRRLMLVK